MSIVVPQRLLALQSDIKTSDPQSRSQASLRTAIVTIGAFGGLIGLAAMATPISGAIIAHGEVKGVAQTHRVAHELGGVVTEIRVHNGSRVKRGDVLVVLDGTVSGERSSTSARSVNQIIAERARLQAEGSGAASIRFPEELGRRTDQDAAAAMASERRLFQLRQIEQAGQRAQIMARTSQLRSQIGAYAAQAGAIHQQIALIEPERRGVKDLWQRGLVTIAKYNQIERTSADLKGSAASLAAQIAQIRNQIVETDEQARQLARTRRSEAASALASSQISLDQERLRHTDADRELTRRTIRAPFDGTVDKLALSASGDIIRANEIIMQVVPTGGAHEVEASVFAHEIGDIRPGQAARIRFTALNAATTPEYGGRVVFVSPEQTTDPRTGMRFFTVRVAFEFRGKDRQLALRSDMPAEVFLTTTSRSLISYLTKPLRDQFTKAFTDA
jgi:HlyD family secretion protein